ncbi:MAG: TA system VapC family ribonuclease toxin [Candidatus Sulfotelmatobacter sp.]
MIVLDANLLIYSYNRGSSHHAGARAWLENTLSSIEVVGLPWQAVSAFLRVMTSPKLPAERFDPQQAARIVDLWLAHRNVQVLTPGVGSWPLFRWMVIEGRAAGPRVSDAEIAALTMEYGGVLYTADRDFARFPGLRWKNPLE